MSDAEKSAVKHWLASVSIVLILQIGALIWFLAKVDSRIANVEGLSVRVETLWEHYLRTGGASK
jgi:hypothetical protein